MVLSRGVYVEMDADTRVVEDGDPRPLATKLATLKEKIEWRSSSTVDGIAEGHTHRDKAHALSRMAMYPETGDGSGWR